MNNRKNPDLFAVLIAIVVFGVIISGVAQGVNLQTPENHATQVMNAKPVLQPITLFPNR